MPTAHWRHVHPTSILHEPIAQPACSVPKRRPSTVFQQQSTCNLFAEERLPAMQNTLPRRGILRDQERPLPPLSHGRIDARSTGAGDADRRRV